MALTNKLTAIADAIRGKTGKPEEMTLDQMPLEIAGIVIAEEWQRPSNWPDLSSLGRPEPGIVYLTYDCRDTINGVLTGFISVNAVHGIKVHRGRIEDGAFIEEAEVLELSAGGKYGEELPTDKGDFVVYRIDDRNGRGWGLTGYDGLNYHFAIQPCVEIYGSANGNAGSFTVWNSYTGLSAYTKSFILKNMDYSWNLSSYY